MRYFHKTKNQFFKPTISLDKVWTLATEQLRKKYENAKETDKVPVIDVTQAVSSHEIHSFSLSLFLQRCSFFIFSVFLHFSRCVMIAFALTQLALRLRSLKKILRFSQSKLINAFILLTR
jgi:hypothetical protein